MVMKNIAPEITRQRFLIEGYYLADIDEDWIKDCLNKISNSLGLKTYDKAIVFSPECKGRKKNQGYDAFIPLIDSGISLYVWTSSKFFSLLIYSCKYFKKNKALEISQQLFKTTEIESLSF